MFWRLRAEAGAPWGQQVVTVGHLLHGADSRVCGYAVTVGVRREPPQEGRTCHSRKNYRKVPQGQQKNNRDVHQTFYISGIQAWVWVNAPFESLWCREGCPLLLILKNLQP